MSNSIILETKNGKMEMAGDPLKNYIISRIESGEFKPGMPLLSTKKLSHRFGISLITTQKVLKELGDENYLVRQRGKRTIVANRTSQKADIESGDAVGVLFAGIDCNPFHAMLLSAICNYGLSHKIKIISHMGYSSPEAEVGEFLQQLKANNIKYYIQNPQKIKEYWRVSEAIEKSGIKTVMLNDFWYGGGPFSCVRTHEEYGYEMAFKHLMSLGHKRILLLDESRNSPRFYAEQAFKQALWVNNIAFNENMVKYISDSRISSTEFFSRELIDDIINSYTAVHCTYDIYAVRLSEILTASGVKVGKDISIVGFDNIPMAKSAGITTISHPIDQLVAKTFEQLFAKNAENMCICLPPKLIIRNSTGPCPT